MKVTFVYPRFEKFLESIPIVNRALVDHFLGNFTMPPSLGIPILAALTPKEWEVELLDDNNGDSVDAARETDLVAINCFTPQASRAFELADAFRNQGKQVVMGGFFPSTMPKEALEHADAVNIGDGEPTWTTILEDVKAGRLRPVYRGRSDFDLSALPPLRRDLFYEKAGYDWAADLVQTARGCTYTCGMCAIPTHQGHKIRLRAISDIVDEVRGLRFDSVYLADDVLYFTNRRIVEWASQLFRALEPLGKSLFVSSTPSLNTSNEILDLSARAGVTSFYCTLNVDTKSIRALAGDAPLRQEIIDLVHRVEDRGMRFFASFGIGRDWDGEKTVDSILDLCARARIRTAEFFCFTPYPGATLWQRLERQGRILHRDWRLYNGVHVVWRPLGVSPEKLYELFVLLWSEFYRAQRWEDTIETLKPETSDEHMSERRRRVEHG
jgi:radical SAM superfamily enzyme YgiQ (UPF0313 family)